MECVKYSVEKDVPPALASVTTASTSFYTLPHPLHSHEDVQHHTVLATKQGKLVEVVDGGEILHSTTLTSGNVTKIVVHHVFDPRQLYIVLLFSTNRVTILNYTDFKVLCERDGIADVSSEDKQATGAPQLLLTTISDEVEIISNVHMLTLCGQGEVEEGEEGQQGKREAIDALAKRLKGGMRQAEQLRGQRRAKESYIKGSLLRLQSQLAGRQDTAGTTLMPALTLSSEEGNKDVPTPHQQQQQQQPLQPPLRVIDIRHKMVHNKWVIGVNVVNDADRFAVHNPQLVLCSGEGTHTLTYSSMALKIVRHSSSRNTTDTPPPGRKGQVQVTIIALDPPVLRPGKKTCVLATCELPSFLTGPTVTCSGLLTYTCRSLRTWTTQTLVPGEEGKSEGKEVELQASLGVIKVRADELEAQEVALDHDPVPGGVSFSCVALVAGSYTSRVALTTLSSPLTDFISRITQRFTLVKVCGVSDFFCFYPEQPHPLRHVAFTFHLPDTHCAHLTLYTKDERQALVAVHSLLAALPCDTAIKPAIDSLVDHEDAEKLRHNLLRKMSEVASCVIEGYETWLKENQRKKKKTKQYIRDVVDASKKESDNPRDRRLARQQEASQHATGFVREQEELEVREVEVKVKAEEYRAWRGQLQEIQREMDKLYVKYVGLN